MPHDASGNEWMIAECPRCGLVAAGPRGYVAVPVALHFRQEHPEMKLVRVGVEWTMRVAPTRCDTCSNAVELPYWTHISDPPTSSATMIDADGRWVLCDACHAYVVANDAVGWAKHCWSNAVRQSPFIAHGANSPPLRLSLSRHLALLLTNIDAGERNTLWKPPPLTP